MKPERTPTERRVWAIVHNCIAHPLLALSASIDWFHDWTAAKAWPEG